MTTDNAKQSITPPRLTPVAIAVRMMIFELRLAAHLRSTSAALAARLGGTT